MSVLWCVTSLSEVKNNEKFASWLQRLNIQPPPGSENSHYPTPKEIHQVLEELNGYEIKYHIRKNKETEYLYFAPDDKWGHYEVESEWAATIKHKEDESLRIQLEVIEFCGDEDVPHDFLFAYGNGHLALYIVEKISKICGPFIFTTDTDSIRPILVVPGINVNQEFET